MLTEYKKEQRAQINRAFAEKQAALGIKTFRFSLPEGAQTEFTDMAEYARAEHYAHLVDTLPDGAPELAVLAESNKTQPLPAEALEQALQAGFKTLVEDYQSRLEGAVSAENAAHEAHKRGDDVAATRLRAKSYVDSCYMKIHKTKILAILA